jgi:hypothetical protein
MLVEYKCVCGFRTVFPHKYFKHAKSCEAMKRLETEGLGNRRVGLQ